MAPPVDTCTSPTPTNCPRPGLPLAPGFSTPGSRETEAKWNPDPESARQKWERKRERRAAKDKEAPYPALPIAFEAEMESSPTEPDLQRAISHTPRDRKNARAEHRAAPRTEGEYREESCRVSARRAAKTSVVSIPARRRHTIGGPGRPAGSVRQCMRR